MNAAVRELQEVLGEKAVAGVARQWGIPSWVLYDWLHGKTKCPRAEYLPAIARGMDKTVEEVIVLATQNGESPPSDPAP